MSKSVYSILAELAATNSGNDKIAILTANKSNETLKRVCLLANDDTLFFIKKPVEFISRPDGMTLESAIDQLEQISRRIVTGNAAIEFLASLLTRLSAEDADVLARIVKKDLDSGFSDSTCNKIWKNLIEDVPYMRCSKGDEKGMSNIVYPAFAQTKADGMFFNIFIEQGKETVIKTRSGKEVHVGSKVAALFDGLNQVIPYDIVLHGEGLVREKNGSTMDRKKGNGLLTKLQKCTATDAELDEIRSNMFFKVWDYIPASEFKPKGSFKSPAIERFGFVAELVKTINSDRVLLIESVEVADYDEAFAFYKRMRAAGEEGAILKNKSSIWEDKTSKNLVKMKAEEDCDLLCVGYEPHSKDPNLIGSLLLESSDGKIKVKAGSGLSKEDREQKPEYFLDKIVAVVYNERISSKSKDTDSLFLPRIVEAPRLDKTVADHSKDIK